MHPWRSSIPKLVVLLVAGASLLGEGAARAAEYIVDNADGASVAVTGSWAVSTATYGYFSTDYLSDQNAGNGTKSVRFTPTIPVAGDFDVYLRWTAGDDRASNVPVDVLSANGTTTVLVNQQDIGGAWIKLTTAHFNAGTGGSVLVRTDATDGVVIADAVRLLTAGTPPNTLVEKLTPMEPARMLNGLGWNINLDQEWEYQKVKEARGREVRIQFGWESVEAMDGTLSLPAKFQNALAWCVKYGLQPLIVAAYAPPWTKAADLTVTSKVSAGSYVLPVSGTAALPYTDFSNLGAIVVDNADATRVAITGAWSQNVGVGSEWPVNPPHTSLHDQGTGKGMKSVRFTPTLPFTGSYDIYVWYPVSGSAASSVPIDVTTASGTETISMAQNANGGSWRLLKRAACNAGTGSSVLIRTDGTAAGEKVLADAAAWVPVAGTEAPIHAYHVKLSNESQFVLPGQCGPYGALIDSVDPTAGTITLGVQTSIDLPAGTTLKVNRLRYASAATISGTDPASMAYARYAKYLADQVAAYGLTGRVELWNEPPFAYDGWDHRNGYYDNPPIGTTTFSPNYGLQRGVLDQILPTGVRYSWGGSHKAGSGGVLNSPLPKPTQTQVANAVTTEGWHPYHSTPEWHLWNPDLLLGTSNLPATALEGTSATSNHKGGRRTRALWLAANGWTVTDQISETGHATSDETARARWVTRAFLSNLCIGPAPFTDRVDFYRLTDVPGKMGFINASTRGEQMSFAAVKGLMDDVHGLAAAALGFTSADLPSVSSYAGSFPLTTIPLVGRASASETKNHLIYVCYQRSYAKSDSPAAWDTVVVPPVPVTVNIPTGYTARRAWDVATRQPVSISVNAGRATYLVADNPVALLLVPPTVIGKAPTAANDAVTMDEGSTVDIDVLANDADPDFGPETLFIQSVAAPAHGTASIFNGKVRYTPNAGFYGTDSFNYSASDGDANVAAGIVVTVNSTATAYNLNAGGLTGSAVGTGSGSSRALADGTWEVNGSGTGLGGTADALWFESLAQAGAFRVRVQLQSVAGGTDARAGLLLREGAGAGARFIALAAGPDGITRYLSRSVAGSAAAAEQAATVPSAFPGKWLLLERVGDDVALRVDDDNDGYTEVARVKLSGLTSSLNIGLFTTGGAGGAPARAAFANFDKTALVTWDGGAGNQNLSAANNWDPDGAPVTASVAAPYNLALPSTLANGSATLVKQDTALGQAGDESAARLGSLSIAPGAMWMKSLANNTALYVGRNLETTNGVSVAHSSGVVTNAGTMHTDTANAWILRFAPVTHVNSGVIEAQGATAEVRFDAGTPLLRNTGGIIRALTGGKVSFTDQWTVVNGSVTTDATSQIQTAADGRTADFTGAQIANAGTWLHQQASSTQAGLKTCLTVFNGATVLENTGTFKLRQAMTAASGNAQTAVVEFRDSAQLINRAAGTVLITNESTTATAARVARLDFPESGTTFTNLGTVTISDGAQAGISALAELRSTAAFTNQGQITLTGTRAALTMAGTEPYRQSGGRTVLGGGTLTAPGVSIEGGSLGGSGAITGDLVLGSAATFEAQLQAGAASSLVQITGQAQLGGMLQITLVGGYVPAIGTEFRIVSAASGFAGTFQNMPTGWATVTRGADLYLQRLVALTAWRQRYYGTTANAGPAADAATPDGDNIANLTKYALVITPGTSAGPAMPACQRRLYAEGERLAIVFNRDPDRSDITVEVQAADDLGGAWTTLATSAAGAAFSGPGFVSENVVAGSTLKSVEVRDLFNTKDKPRRFLRFRSSH